MNAKESLIFLHDALFKQGLTPCSTRSPPPCLALWNYKYHCAGPVNSTEKEETKELVRKICET
jgi:hypothetical protein